MNIIAAANNIKIGYHVRRASWEPEDYLYELVGVLNKKEKHIRGVWDSESRSYIDRDYDDPFIPNIQDLLADDWEIV